MLYSRQQQQQMRNAAVVRWVTWPDSGDDARECMAIHCLRVRADCVLHRGWTEQERQAQAGLLKKLRKHSTASQYEPYIKNFKVCQGLQSPCQFRLRLVPIAKVMRL